MPPKKKQKLSHSKKEDAKESASEWFWVQSLHNELVLSTNPETGNVNVWHKKDFRSDDQLWKLDSDGYMICAAYDNKVLEIAKADPTEGTIINLWKKLSGKRPNQRWKVTGDGHIKSEMNGMCMDIYDDDKGAGSDLMTWPERKHKWQRWKFIPADEEKEDVKQSASEWFWIQSLHNELVLSTNPETGNVNVWHKKNFRSDDQLWKLDSDGYMICAAYDNKVLEIAKADPTEGTIINLWKKLSGKRPNQRWKVTGDGHIKSEMNGMCMDIYDDDKGAGSDLMTWPERKHKWQRWKFIPADDADGSTVEGVEEEKEEGCSKSECATTSLCLETIQGEWGSIEEAVVKRKKGDCNICFTETSGTVIMSTNCAHLYCKSCAKSTLESCVGTGNFPLRCPACAADSSLPKERGLVTRAPLKGLVKAKVCKDLLAQRVLLGQMRALGKSEEPSVDLAYRCSKPCPHCGLLIVHYRAHGCHHIAPGAGCSGCHHHFCWICLHDSGTTWAGCPNKCSLFCSKSCKECAICPDCQPGESCSACSGNCPSCAYN